MSTKPPSRGPWLLVAIACLGVGVCVGLAASRFTNGNGSRRANAAKLPSNSSFTDTEEPEAYTETVAVKVVHPLKGVMEHVTVQPGTIQGYESVHLYAKVSGYLKTQVVDIGDRVRRRQPLAVVDVPELDKLAQRNRASVDQCQARVLQMKSRVATAKADILAAEAQIVQTEAAAKSAAAWVRFRDKQYVRMRELHDLKSIDERLVDEAKERHEAAIETERSAQAAIATAKAQLASSHAKLQQAEADVVEAESQVKVAEAELEKTEVQIGYSTIYAPFDGVVTSRSLFPGDFVRSAGEGGTQLPLLTIQRTDRMRVIVQVPDRDVPYADVGDPAMVQIDAFPDRKYDAKVSRIAHSEDPQTRLMRVEIDLPNPTGEIREGMYGRVTILLDKSPDILSVPSACLVGKAEKGKANVFVVEAGKAHCRKVQIGTNNGIRVELLAGLTESDEVILQPSSAVADGTEVEITPTEPANVAKD
jgi:RND family efflux transporter MFP subunit